MREVATTLTFCACLLHDALEDTEAIDAAIIEQFFGSEVARRVRLLTKIPKEGYFDRLVNADSWTQFIKLCDRLDNLRSLPADDPAFSSKTLKETRHLLDVLGISRKSNPSSIETAILEIVGDVPDD